MFTPRSSVQAAEALVAQASRRLKAGDAAEASRLALAALGARKGYAPAVHIAAAALNTLRLHREALEILPAPSAAQGLDAATLFELAYALTHHGQPDAAMPLIDRLDGLAPRTTEVAALRGAAHAIAGRYERAVETLTPLVGLAPPHDLLRRELDRAAVETPTRRTLLFSRAEILDAVGEFDRAWVDLTAARALGSAEGYAPERFSAAVDRLISTWTPEHPALLGASSTHAARAILVVGMWRSGTTLVHQVLAANPRIAGAGELNVLLHATKRIWPRDTVGGVAIPGDPATLTKPDAESIGREYAKALLQASMDATRVVDKMPLNMLCLGLAAAALPGTRVVRCVRDPVDTCLSCLFQIRGAVPYCDRLDWLGRFYADAERADAHWAGTLALPRLRVVYEDHVADPEVTARSLAAFSGTPWDERMQRHEAATGVAMTRSIDQVRKPVYQTSVKRWTHYQRHLGPLIEALGPAASA
jgi:tetratricopeptide (TPR) repeat protein